MTIYSKLSRWAMRAWAGLPEPRLLVVLACCAVAFCVGVTIGRALYNFAQGGL